MPFTPSDCGLQRHNRSDSLASIAESIRRDGGAVIRNLVDTATVNRLLGEIEPHLEARAAGFRGFGEDGFYGSNTKRMQGLAARSRTFVDDILLHPVLLGLADEILLPHCGDYWMSQAETIFIGPGSKAQVLHRDDINWSYAAQLGFDLQISALVAVGDYDAEVGATMVIPGDAGPGVSGFDRSLARPVEMNPGDALVYVGSTVHGGGANVTADRWRKAIYVGYLLGWLTPEESVPLSIPPDTAATLPVRARELLGWSNIHGNRADDSVASQLQLWQMDSADTERTGGAWVERD